MSGHISHQPVTSFLRAALECSIYHAPTEPGLTAEELMTAGEAAGFLPGEIGDALPYATTQSFGGGSKRLQLSRDLVPLLMIFIPREEPDYRNVAAFDFVFAELRQSARAHGAANARIERGVMVERAVLQQVPRLDVEVAITIMVLNEILVEKDGILGFASGKAGYGTPSDQLKTPMQIPPIRKDARARAYPIVKDIIAHRTDGRPKSAELLAACADEKLAYGDRALKDITHQKQQNHEWISAADAINLVGMKSFAGTRTICKRAHAGLIKGRAERFIRDGRPIDDADIPAEFWWAEGEAALNQNWITGDFDTWINQRLHLEAFGVTFRRSDIERLKPTARDEGQQKMKKTGKTVFIGHGRSEVWRALKDFLQDRLHLTIVEFNSVPIAGIATANRLEEMLDAADFALLVLTAEDEQAAGGKLHARLNVVHEAGLFQGRLGFRKAIIVLEEACEEFSNVHGLGQIRFPMGNIGTTFEEIRRVLEREGLVSP
jgi:predicted nucleotide-binding protein